MADDPQNSRLRVVKPRLAPAMLDRLMLQRNSGRKSNSAIGVSKMLQCLTRELPRAGQHVSSQA